MLLKQSTARNALVFMASSTDHVTGATGLTLTITASKDGGAFSSISPTVTERGTGFYNLALTTAHTDTLGDFGLHITSTGADPTDLVYQVVGDLPGASVSSVTGAVGSVTAGVTVTTNNDKTGYALTQTFPTNFSALAITAGGVASANATQFAGQTITCSGGVTIPAATLASTTNITAGTITTVTNLTNAPTAGDFTATMKTSLNAATPASITGNVGGNVTGSVGSVLGNVGGTVATVTNLTNLPSIPSNWITAAGITASALNGKGDWLLASGYSAPPSAASIRSEMDANSTKLAYLDASVSSRMETFTYTAPPSVSAIRAEMDSNSTKLANLDATVSSRSTLAAGAAMTLTAAYDSAKSALTTLGANAPAGWLNAAAFASSALNGKGDWLLSSGYTAPDNTTLSHLGTAMELNSGNYRFTSAALANAPTGSGLDAAGVRSAVGLASANMDTQLSGIKAKTDTITAAPTAVAIRTEMDSNSTKLANLDAPVSSRLATLGTNAPAGWLNAASIAASALNGKGDWLLSSGYTVPPTAVAIRTEIDANSMKLANLDATVSSRMATFAYTAPDNATIGNIYSRIGVAGAGLTAIGDTRLANLDAAVSSRLASSNYTAPDNTTLTHLGTAYELNAGSYRLTSAALALAPTGSGSGLDASGVRSALGMSSANLDTQLSGISGKTVNLPANPAAVSDIPSASALASAVWSAASRTLSSFGFSVNVGQWGGTAVGSMPNSTAPDNTSVAAIKAKTDNLPAYPAAVSDIPSVSAVASAVWSAATRTLTALGIQVDVGKWGGAAVGGMPVSSTPSASSVASAVRTELAAELARIDEPVSSVASAFDPAQIVEGILTASGLEAYDPHTVGRVLNKLDIGEESAPVLVVPGSSNTGDECVVYLYDEQGDGAKLRNRTLTFTLSGYPTSIGDVVIDTKPVVMKTNSEGLLSGSLKRTDLMLPTGRTWIVTSSDVGFEAVTLELTDAGPVNLKELVP